VTSSVAEPPEPEPGCAALAEQVAALRQTLAEFQRVLGEQRGQLAATDARIDDAAARMDAAGLEDLAGRFARLAQTVADALDAASPKGPPLPRWDTLAGGPRDLEVARVAKWVRDVLRPLYIEPAGENWLPECWRQHPAAVAELSWLAIYWRYIWDRPRPGPVKDAAEWHDRWLPGVTRRVSAVLGGCRYAHQGAGEAARAGDTPRP